MKIFVINLGSTSTKVALFDDLTRVWEENTHHPVSDIAHFGHINQQLAYREATVRRMLAGAGIPVDFDAVIARGGLLQPTPGGVYLIDDLIKHDLIHARMEHACNLSALIADDLARECGCPAFIADPEVVDELMPEARLTGIPGIERISIFHALNSKAVSRRYAEAIGRPYDSLRLIVAHLGGGISVGAHLEGSVVDVNNALNGDGPFSPERAGSVPADQLAELCFSGRHTLREIKKMLNGRGGMAAHLGVTDMIEVTARAQRGEQPFSDVVNAMIYNIAKEIGSRAVALRGRVDAIILTGGIAYSRYIVDRLKEWISWIGPIVELPGEDEMASLAYNAYGAMTGRLKPRPYAPPHPLEERYQEAAGEIVGCDKD